MLRALRNSVLAAGFSALPLIAAGEAFAAKATASQALGLAPMQADVDIDRPDKEEAEKCVLESVAEEGVTGYVLKTATGRILRKFLDTNKNDKIDLWCYYKDGVEVYRDIDTNHNNKADQYRWLGTAGVRWGIDSDEDGRIDAWKMISAEEATAEVVAAFREGDPTRFERLLLTPAELKGLGLGEQRTKELAAQVQAAPAEFRQVMKKQRVVGPKSEWIHFGGTRPGILPAGTEGSLKDVVVYDNVSAVVETGGKHAQINIGTLIRVGESWRIIDVPENLLDDAKVAKLFLVPYEKDGVDKGDPSIGEGVTPEVQNLIRELDTIDKQLASASAAQQARLHGRRCDHLEKLINLSKPGEDRANWIHQYADTVAAAVQLGVFPEGVTRLDKLDQALAGGIDANLTAYVKFRAMTAGYNASLQAKDPPPDYPKIQVQWNEDLEAFVKAFPKSPDAAEAMLQLALAQESEGKEEGANNWYTRIASEFATLPIAKKASGARRRLASVGTSIELKAKSLDGQSVDLAALRGKVVVIHYWATWCEPCKQDMEALKQLQAKFASAKKPLQIIGVNLDNEAATAVAFLKTNRLPWPQLFEAGGLEGRLATELGIWTLPTMILVDKEGKVSNRDIQILQLGIELEKQLK